MPWYDFVELPFVVVKFQGKLGHFTEVTVDLQKSLWQGNCLLGNFNVQSMELPDLLIEFIGTTLLVMKALDAFQML